MALAAAPSPTLSTRSLGYAGIWLTMAISAIVWIEPAPFDFAIVALALLFLLCGLRIPFRTAPMIATLALFVLGGMIGTLFTSYFAETVRHVFITGYLCAAAIFIAALVAREPDRALRVLFSGYVAAAVLAAIAAVVGYFSLFPGAQDLFTEFGRARGPFKDANVFGPFLIPPALLCLHAVLTRPASATLAPLALFAFLVFAVLLSFSRGAWGNMALSTAVLVVLLLITTPGPRLRARLLVWSIGAAILAVGVVSLALSVDRVAQLMAERAQIFQAYDTGGHGRFAAQVEAFSLMLVSPFGIGARDFAHYWGEEAHNVYLTVFLSSGWLGGFSYLVLVLLTVSRALALAVRPGPHRHYGAVLAASFIGVAAEGVLVDTDHWRSFYILAGMIWGLPLVAASRSRLGGPSSLGSTA